MPFVKSSSKAAAKAAKKREAKADADADADVAPNADAAAKAAADADTTTHTAAFAAAAKMRAKRAASAATTKPDNKEIARIAATKKLIADKAEEMAAIVATSDQDPFIGLTNRAPVGVWKSRALFTGRSFKTHHSSKGMQKRAPKHGQPKVKADDYDSDADSESEDAGESNAAIACVIADFMPHSSIAALSDETHWPRLAVPNA